MKPLTSCRQNQVHLTRKRIENTAELRNAVYVHLSHVYHTSTPMFFKASLAAISLAALFVVPTPDPFASPETKNDIDV